MRNVIIFAVTGGRFAVDLRWVREVITMGYVTPVPGAPAHIGGAVNVRGIITPVIALDTMDARDSLVPSRRDTDEVRRDGAVLLDVDGLAMALRIAKVDEVITASEGQHMPERTCQGAVTSAVLDSKGVEVPLIDPPELVRITLAAAHTLAAGHGQTEPPSGDWPEGELLIE